MQNNKGRFSLMDIKSLATSKGHKDQTTTLLDRTDRMESCKKKDIVQCKG